MEKVINRLFNLSLTDRLYVIECLLKSNKDCQILPMEQLEQEIKNVVQNSQFFLENGHVQVNQIYKSKF